MAGVAFDCEPCLPKHTPPFHSNSAVPRDIGLCSYELVFAVDVTVIDETLRTETRTIRRLSGVAAGANRSGNVAIAT